MTASVKKPRPDSPRYVIEIHDEEEVFISFRRADMTNPQARDALRFLLGVWFRAEIIERDIDNILTTAPPEWLYITVRFASHGRYFIGPAKREPGKNSPVGNPVITCLPINTRH